MIHTKPLSPDKFKEIYSIVPRLTVDLVIRTDHGIVMTLRSLQSWQNMWHLPGSSVYYGETLNETAYRIGREEAGIEVKFCWPLGYIEYPSEIKERGFGWTISIPILCDWVSGKLQVNNEAAEIKTFNKLPLPDNTISEQKLFLTQRWPEINTIR